MMSDEEYLLRTPSNRIHSLEKCLSEIRDSLYLLLEMQNGNEAAILQRILQKIDCISENGCSFAAESHGRKRSRSFTETPLKTELQQLKEKLRSESLQHKKNIDQYEHQMHDKDREIHCLKSQLSQLTNLKDSVGDELTYTLEKYEVHQREYRCQIRSLRDQLALFRDEKDANDKIRDELINEKDELLKQLNVEREEHTAKIKLMQGRFRAKMQHVEESNHLHLEIVQNELKKSKYDAQTSAKKLKESHEIIDQASDIREMRKELENKRHIQRQLEKKVNELTNSAATAVIQKEKMVQLEEQLLRSESRIKDLLALEEENRSLLEEKNEWRQVFEAHVTSSHLKKLLNNAPSKAAMLLYKKSQNEQTLLHETQGRLRIRIRSLEQKLQEVSLKVLDEGKKCSELSIRNSQLDHELENSNRRIKTLELEKQDLYAFLETYGQEASMSSCSIDREANSLKRIQQLEAKLKERDTQLSTTKDIQQPSPSAVAVEKYKARVESLEAEVKSNLCDNLKLRQEMEKIQVELLEKSARLANTEFIDASTKVIHLTHNPMAEAKDYQIQQLKEEVQRLQQSDSSINLSRSNETARIDYRKQYEVLLKRFRANQDRLKSIFYEIAGYRIDVDYKFNSGEQEVVRVRFKYAQNPNDDIKFLLTQENGLQIVENEFLSRVDPRIRVYLNRFNSVPGFMASLLLRLHENQTFRE